MYIKQQVEILTCDVPNKNKRIYPRKEVEKALVKLREEQKTLWGTVGMPTSKAIPVDDIVFVAENLQLNDKNVLVGDIRMLQTPKKRVFEQMLNDPNVGFRPVGYGKVGEDGVISDWEVISIAIVYAPA